jgi:hypothetical protein
LYTRRLKAGKRLEHRIHIAGSTLVLQADKPCLRPKRLLLMHRTRFLPHNIFKLPKVGHIPEVFIVPRIASMINQFGKFSHIKRPASIQFAVDIMSRPE